MKTAKNLKELLQTHEAQSISYSEYREAFRLQVEAEAAGAVPTYPQYKEYTRLNWQHSSRLDKRYFPSNELVEVLQQAPPQRWLVITETWCGDAAQNLPILAKLSEHALHIQLQVIYRDKFPELMDAFLTNGTRSIPKLIAYDDSYTMLFTWGPRPAEAQKLVDAYKALPEPKPAFAQFSEQLHSWYAKSKGVHLEEELTTELKRLIAPENFPATGSENLSAIR